MICGTGLYLDELFFDKYNIKLGYEREKMMRHKEKVAAENALKSTATSNTNKEINEGVSTDELVDSTMDAKPSVQDAENEDEVTAFAVLALNYITNCQQTTSNINCHKYDTY